MKIKNLLAISFLALGVSASAKDYKYTTVAGDAMQTRIYTFDNGLKVYLSVNKEKPRIQTYIAVRTGSKNDPAETTGLAHYLEHLMFKGTTKFGTNNPEAEKPLLDDITKRYEEYRQITRNTVRLRILLSASRNITRLTLFRSWQPSISFLTNTTNSWLLSELKVLTLSQATM